MNQMLKKNNYLLLDGIHATNEQLASFNNCIHDPYMGNGTRYKRFSQYKAISNNGKWQLELLPPRAYTAPKKFNAVGGGIYRKYEPIQIDFSDQICNFLTQLDLDPSCAWQLNVHQNRSIATAELQGQLTPEGRHTDGHEFVSISVFSRKNIVGGVTRVWSDMNAQQPLFESEIQPGETILLFDKNVMHDVTDIEVSANEKSGTRDILIVAYSRWAERWYGEEHDRIAVNNSTI